MKLKESGPMNVSRQALKNNIMLVGLDGRLDAGTSVQVKDAIYSLLNEGYLKIIVNLEKVSFIDSSGMVALVSGLRLANQQKGQIVLCGVQSQTQLVFRLTMLDRVFSIQPTQVEAMQSLA